MCVCRNTSKKSRKPVGVCEFVCVLMFVCMYVCV